MRFERILVPLDGSRLAEDVLVPVASLASALGAEVTLLHVLERDPPSSVHGERHITDPVEGAAYLEEVAGRLSAGGIAVRTHVHPRGVDSVAAALDAHAHEYGTDLIAMCKHGGSGIRGRIVGSIAQQILKGGSIPIFLRTPRKDGSRRFHPRRILVPLDFEHDIDAVFDAVRDIAHAYGSRVVLFSAVPSLAAARRENVLARLRPSAAAVGLAMEAEEAIALLRERGEQFAAAGIQVEVDISQDDPSDAILAAAGKEGVGLTVLSTHARAGFETWLENSVGGRVIASAPENLLLLREL